MNEGKACASGFILTAVRLPSAGIAYHKIISFLDTFWLQKVSEYGRAPEGSGFPLQVLATRSSYLRAFHCNPSRNLI
jgi:hypothetical protein